MDLEKKIKNIVEEAFDSEDLFLVDIKISKSKLNPKISIFIDSDNGLSIDQCSLISRKIDEPIDSAIDGPYTLEVSSPGIDIPLKTVRQFKKNIGRQLKIELLDKSQVKGKLIDIKEENIIIEELKKKETFVHQLPLNNIKEAKVQVTF